MTRILATAVLLGLTGAAAPALAAEDLAVDRIRGYLVYEDTGDLSKNVARRTDQIVANDENGSSIQMLVDIVVDGPKNELIEGNTYLYVWVTGANYQTGDRPKIDQGWPISYVGLTGEVVRSIVVDHDCEGFEVRARLDDGERQIGRELVKRFDLTCGD